MFHQSIRLSARLAPQAQVNERRPTLALSIHHHNLNQNLEIVNRPLDIDRQLPDTCSALQVTLLIVALLASASAAPSEFIATDILADCDISVREGLTGRLMAACVDITGSSGSASSYVGPLGLLILVCRLKQSADDFEHCRRQQGFGNNCRCCVATTTADCMPGMASVWPCKLLVQQPLQHDLDCLLPAAAGRFLQAASYDCDGVKKMSSVPNACSMLCDCVGNLNSLYAMFRNMCMDRCNSCAAAATQQCTKAGMPLPSACQGGGSNTEVSTCINQFLSQHQITAEKAPAGQQQKAQQQQRGQQQQGQKPASASITQQG